MTTEKRYFFGLDIVRFMAALLVAIFHLGFWATIAGSTPNKTLKTSLDFSAISNFAWSGWVGVEVFFVISGFVIAGSAHMTPAWKFLRGRILRLYPAAWLCASITFAVLLLNGQGPASALLAKYLHSLSLSPYDNGWGWIDGVYWTLQYEISFYGIILLTLPFRKYISLMHVAYTFTGLSAAYIAACLARSSGLYVSPLLGWAEAHPYAMIAIQARYGCLFAAGIWLWAASSGTMTKLRATAFLISICGALGEVFMHANEFIGNPFNSERSPITPLTVFGIAFFVIAILTSPKLKISLQPRTAAALRTIGLMTYPFYLLHDIVGAFTMRLLALTGINDWLVLLGTFLIVGAASIAVCNYIEPVIRRALGSLIPGPAQRSDKQAVQLPS